MPTPVCSDLWMLSSISAPMFSQHCNTDVQLIIGTQLPFLAFTSSTMWTQKRLCVKSSCLSATSHNLWTLLEVVSWSDLSTYIARVRFFSSYGILEACHLFLGACQVTEINEKLPSVLVNTLYVCCFSREQASVGSIDQDLVLSCLQSLS